VNAFDVVFIQEPPWRHIRSVPSAHNKEGEDVVGPPMHPAWKLLMRPPQNGEPPRVIAYVSRRLNSYSPAIRRDLVDHRDLLLLSHFAEGSISYLLNVYSDADHTANRFLADKQDVASGTAMSHIIERSLSRCWTRQPPLGLTWLFLLTQAPPTTLMMSAFGPHLRASTSGTVFERASAYESAGTLGSRTLGIFGASRPCHSHWNAHQSS
ncbi:hypothetical protein CVT26_006122, partial [Gymnopilus dilepis]